MNHQQQNPYMNLYLNSLDNNRQKVSKDYLFMLAVNLGQVHNVFGTMISDVIQLMGRCEFNQQKRQRHHLTQNDFRGQQQIQQNNPAKRIYINNKHKGKKSQRIIIQHQPQQKMQIQNLSIEQFNDRMKSQPIIKKQTLLNEFQFQFNQQKQQSDNINYQPKGKKKIFNQLFYQINQNNDFNEYDGDCDNKRQQQKQHSIESSSNTLSAQKVRYQSNYYNQFQRQPQFQQLPQKQHKKHQQQHKYQIKVNKVHQQIKKQNSNKKNKSIFFDLFDSSQTNSYPQQQEQQQELMQRFSPISQQRTYNDKLFYKKQKQISQNSNPVSTKYNNNNLFKQKSISYSSQIKYDKVKSKQENNIKNNNNAKSSNLLESFSVKSPKSNLINIDEIDEIETSHKKVPEKKIIIKRKVQQKQQPAIKAINNNESFDQYIPRRDDIGRKKVNRQNAKGSQCPDCKAFYDAINEDSRSFKTICQCTSRHKSSTTFMNKHKVQNYSQAFSLD